MLKRNMMQHRGQRGLSLVELMVGIVVGMFVVAAASTLIASQLSDNRRLLLELQVQQDLRATADIITRDLRRIGASETAINGSQGVVWDSTQTPGSKINRVFATLLKSEADWIEFSSPREDDQTGPYGYKLVTDTSKNLGVIKSRIAQYQDAPNGGWTDLTDADAVKITHFSLSWKSEPAVQLVCQKLCDTAVFADAKACWPTVTVRAIEVVLKGQARSDPSVVREVRSLVRMRNELLEFKANASDDTLSCPS